MGGTAIKKNSGDFTDFKALEIGKNFLEDIHFERSNIFS